MGDTMTHQNPTPPTDPRTLWASPMALALDEGLTRDERLQMLDRWRDQALAESVATSEGMPGDSNEPLREVELAMDRLRKTPEGEAPSGDAGSGRGTTGDGAAVEPPRNERRGAMPLWAIVGLLALATVGLALVAWVAAVAFAVVAACLVGAWLLRRPAATREKGESASTDRTTS